MFFFYFLILFINISTLIRKHFVKILSSVVHTHFCLFTYIPYFQKKFLFEIHGDNLCIYYILKADENVGEPIKYIHIYK